MTVSSSTNRISYAGNGSTTVFAYTFKIFADGDLTVTLRAADGSETELTLTTHYTVSGAGDDAGGNVTIITPPATGETLVMVRQLDLLQETDYVENDPFPAETHEEALDRACMMIQQLNEIMGRCLKLAISSSYSAIEIPDPESQYFLRWKSTLDGLENIDIASIGALAVSTFMKTLLDDTDAAGARATLAAAALGANDFADTTQKKMNFLDCGIITNAIGSIGGGTQDIDLTLGNSVSGTVDTSETTFTFSNPTASDELCIFSFYITNGESQTTNWPALGGLTMPTLTTSGVDLLIFFTINGGTNWNLYSYMLDL